MHTEPHPNLVHSTASGHLHTCQECQARTLAQMLLAGVSTALANRDKVTSGNT